MAVELKTFHVICFMLITMVSSRGHSRPSHRKLDLSEDLGIALRDGRGSSPQALEYEMPIHRFARHVLCQNKTGKLMFYDAMSEKLGNLSDGFVESFIYDLCGLHTRGDSFLDRWVKELFDTDSNGYISQAELHYYYS